MPLPLPIIDDRSYQQLRDELLQRIPVYNPEWTDHNPSDPGITLLELFAFLGENLLFRFNQIPEATRLAFLKLLQIPLRAAAAAEGLVTLQDPQFASRPAPARAELGKIAVLAGRVPFEVQTEVTVAPWTAVVVARTQTTAPSTTEGQEFAQIAIDALELSDAQAPAFYVNTTIAEDPSAPEAQAVHFGETVDNTVWIAVLGEEGTVEPMLDLTLNVGFVPDETLQPGDTIDPCPGVALAGSAAASATSADDDLVWEISTGRLDADNQPVYKALEVAGDTTTGLRARGVVRLRLPRELGDVGTFVVEDAALEGTGALPPLLDDPAQRAQTRFWLRAWRRSGQERFGRVLWMGLNAAEVVQQRRAPTEFLGTGTAQAGQRYRLVNRNVVEGSLVIEVEEQRGQWKRWTAVPSFEASREDDKHYVVDLEAGEVLFGNGVQGLAPQVGERVRATTYRWGGGSDGNVAAKTITKLDGGGAEVSGLKVSNPLPTRGGAAAESVAEALERLPGELRRHDRAVTASDFQELALATPGADLGRAECLPLYFPATGATDAAGVVSVVVWPRQDAQHPDAPLPERSTLRRVCAWLDQRRLVTTELYVIPPAYVKIAVSVGLRVKPGYGVDAVRAWVDKVIRQYLAPLPPYGPEGQGWPLGRRVYAPELEAAVLQVEGVQYLESDGVAVARQQTDGSWGAGTVELGPNEVPELVTLTVVQGPRLAPGETYTAPPVATPVPIPTVPETC